MKSLTVLFDATCGFCHRCSRWLAEQKQYVRLEVVPAGSSEARRRFPGLEWRDATDELVVVGDTGAVYRGDRAFLICLWALVEYRDWSLRLASPSLRPLARRAFALISTHRQDLSRLLARTLDDAGNPAGVPAVPACPPESGGSCRTTGS
jgi:predicted DCC family thiol-disulfide oxidoreductase YuxK